MPTVHMSCSIFQAQTRQCALSSPHECLGPCAMKLNGRLLNARLSKSMVQFDLGHGSNMKARCSNTKAWSKVCENFYGDDDDTLFEPLSENPLIFAKDFGIINSHIPAWTHYSWLSWIFGPFILLTTGVIPTLWLPYVPLFEGSSTAGLLALAGLDGIFNLGASIFLLITDSCAWKWRRVTKRANSPRYELPSSYKAWTMFGNMVGLLLPLVIFVASKKGLLGPEPGLLPIAAMIVPYLALLLVRTVAELLVWQWQSPVWSILPLVYGCYSVLQLSRGLQLGRALGAPLWTTEAVKTLICWWVFVLALQLMWIAWFVGSLQS